MSKKAVTYMADHLGDFMPSSGGTLRTRVEEGMALASTWADGLADETSDYHFSHSPWRNCAKFDLKRDCKEGRCLVTGLERFFMDSQNIELCEKERADAVKFLIHLVADAVQPLHTGFHEDAGANTIMIQSPVKTNLHAFWDFDLVELAIESSGKSFEQVVEEMTTSTAKKSLIPESLLEANAFGEWIVSHTAQTYTCNKAYVEASGKWIGSGASLSERYVSDRIPVVWDQLERAAVMLREILDFVAEKYWEGRRLTEPKTTTTPSPSGGILKSVLNVFSFLNDRVKPKEEVQEEPEKKLLSTITAAEEPPTTFKGIDLRSLGIKQTGKDFFISKKSFLLEDPEYVGIMNMGADITIGDSGELRHASFDVIEFHGVEIDQQLVTTVFKSLGFGERVHLVQHDKFSDWIWKFLRRTQQLNIPVARSVVSGPIVADKPSVPVTVDVMNTLTLVILPQLIVIFKEADWEPRNGVFRFSTMFTKINQNPFLLLTEPSLDDINMQQVLMFIAELSQKERATRKGEQLMNSHPKLINACLCIAELSLFGADQKVRALTPTLEKITILKREDRPYLSSIEFTLDENFKYVWEMNEADRLVVRLGEGKTIVSAKHLLETDLDLDKMVFFEVANDCFVDSRIAVDPGSARAVFAHFLNAKAKTPFTPVAQIGAGRMARALKEWDRMLQRKKGKRVVLEKYEMKGKMLTLLLFPLKR
jgi:hypothetical protein